MPEQRRWHLLYNTRDCTTAQKLATFIYLLRLSRREIGDFRNAMLGRADKGIFITTGWFSPDAETEASREGVPPIELVDGERLVALFQSKMLGVRKLEVFEVDNAFFDQFRS